jgi:hypothetical protein
VTGSLWLDVVIGLAAVTVVAWIALVISLDRKLLRQ